MTNRSIVFLGAGLLLLGLFVPAVQMPYVGNQTVFGNGNHVTPYLFLPLIGLIGFFAFKEQTEDAYIPGIAIGAILLALFINVQINISYVNNSFAESMARLEGNPYAASMAEMYDSASLQWGWLVLIAGVACTIYGAFEERKANEVTDHNKLAKLSGLFGVLAVGWLAYQSYLLQNDTPADVTEGIDANEAALNYNGQPPMPSEVEQYIKNVEVYDVEASYRDSMLDGRVPGVDFKVKNNGDRSLDLVEVTVVFYNSEGQPIAEDTFMPVIVSSFDNDPPLRPGYIWQQERGSFYAAKSVPDEWQSGKVSAKVTRIEFAPEN
ncbi:hypothetical protein K7H13_13630 [Qipengyuania citrea]|uniref:hypothetical protein n=1 Tax=Qipengyuania citrea TaxID=225971 RepID=UPI001E3971A4|nr:hypothetical protein [Qipengyuania citrea]MCD1591789.1 hypothetical protein [Qipengyuania citrea]